jgi:hypothetical protein
MVSLEAMQLVPPKGSWSRHRCADVDVDVDVNVMRCKWRYQTRSYSSREQKYDKSTKQSWTDKGLATLSERTWP